LPEVEKTNNPLSPELDIQRSNIEKTVKEGSTIGRGKEIGSIAEITVSSAD
jgi:hypothetical protein